MRTFTLLALLVAAPAAAQTVTITRPGAEPVVVVCSLGCTFAVAPPVVEPPPPPPCTFLVSPATLTFTAAGGAQPVTVTASRDGCLTEIPAPSSTAPWVTLDATRGALAEANPSTVARAAVLTVAGRAIPVTQLGVPIVEPPPPPPPPPTGSVLSRLNCTAANFPDCGIGYWGRLSTGPGVYDGHTVERVGNGARFRLTPSSSQGQFYLGWQMPAQNSTANAIYIRYRLTINGPFRGRGVGDVWSDKLVIVNNGGSTRAIGELKPQRTADITDVTLAIQKNIDGGVTLTPRLDLTPGRRYAVQMRVSRGSAVRFATCLDQPVEALCTQSGTFSYNPASFQNVGVGFYSNAKIAAGQNVDFTLEDVEVGTTFDPNFR